MNPRISVLMSAYNAENCIAKSIESVINQSFRDFEFIVINDCSTDNTLQVINSYADPRIITINNEHNLGLTKSLNLGLKRARGEFIARIDADDQCTKDRFKKQLLFLEERDLPFCGSEIRTVDEEGREIRYFEVPTSPELINATIFFKNVFAHPTLVIRASLLKNMGGYDEEFKFAQDYRLLLQLFTKGKFGLNVPEKLLVYSVAESNISKKSASDQNYFAARAIQKSLKESLKYNLDISDISSLRKAVIYGDDMTLLTTLRCVKYFRVLYRYIQNLYPNQYATHKEMRKIINRVIDGNVPFIIRQWSKRYVYMGTEFNI